MAHTSSTSPTKLFNQVKEYQQLLALFTAHLNNYCSGLSGRQPRELYQPEEYILSLGGKRLRPLFALIGCEVLGGDPQKALDAALSVELFHNFSLVHDDILDAAPLRRNQPTVHMKWGTNVAILSGDVMLVKALQLLARYPDPAFRQLSELLQRTAVEVCEGQQMDMNFEQRNRISVYEYLRMIEYKTAVLLGCSLQMGAICAGAPAEAMSCLYDFGKHTGIAFQLNDDLLDAYARDEQGFGKQKGGDIIANKKTYLLTRALELATPEQAGELQALAGCTDHEEKISKTLAIFEALDVRNHCLREAGRHTAEAVHCLDRLSAPPEKKRILRAFALDLLQRQI
jgi:geranylgeranyl diphosphate synthase, type II